jgi:hypothetical protein
MGDPAQRVGRIYVGWGVASIAAALARSGLDAEATTRLLVLGLLGLQLALRAPVVRLIQRLPTRARFVLSATALACVVEGFHMISTPVFMSLRVDGGTSVPTALRYYLLDLAFTVPSYLVIFAVIERFARAYRYSPWEFVLVMGLGQALGDGGIDFFAAAPWMLVFLPYPMTNYHAVHVLPYFAIEGALDPARPQSKRRFLAVPALIATYFVCGALIKVVGRALGFEPSA